MKITVAICTWNRSQLLDKTLAEMQKLVIPHDVDWQLVIVNNNCTDDTDHVLARHSQSLPLQRLLETKQGLSHARNCAVDACSGDFLIWTDDDVLVDPHWMQEYCLAFQKWPQATFFGGRIRPWFEVDPPAWILNNTATLQGMLVLRELGDQQSKLGERLPFGANMAFRRSVFDEFRFDPRVGIQGSDRIAGEETELFRQLRANGHTGVWVPTASVQHFVTRDRLTVDFMWRYHVGLGRTEVRLNGLAPAEKKLLGAPRWICRLLLESAARSFISRAFAKSCWVRDFIAFAVNYGKWKEHRALLRIDS
jgi:glucosyl-dolichyl phosphate glucuronosyltransferase